MAQAKIHSNQHLISSVARNLSAALGMKRIAHVMEFAVDYYSLDIAIPAIKLGIECDGPFHANPKAHAHDKRRDEYLTAKGWTILRFDNRLIKQNVWNIVKQIEAKKCELEHDS